jgi:hypothetical protein
MIPIVLLALVGYWLVARSSAVTAAGSSASPGGSIPITNVSPLLQSVLDLGGPGGLGYAKFGPYSDPSGWVGGVKPGTVTIGGAAAPSGWEPGTIATAQKAAGLAVSGISAAMGTASAMGSTMFAATGALSAIPFVGVGIAIVGTVLGVLSAHHAAAMAAEGKALNSADPRMYNAQVMVLQGVLVGDLPTVDAARAALSQITADWYGEVKGIIRGRWPYTGEDLSADYQKVWIKRFQPARGAPGFADYHAPDPCNAACVIGHFFTERNAFLVDAAAAAALAGEHGVLVLPMIPPHDSQTGFPEVRVTY